ncbi:hypothetical protein C8R45DRAFT_1019384 [Mycena sanguinolenta]|nr:hypothetical protein C8R45DRAFT_1019384 [Mycena sanguinolenta]
MPLLAPELWQIEIFPRLELVSLIRSRCVDRAWRQMVLDADLPPVRRLLYELYLTVIDSAGFLSSRPRVLAQLRPFDRESYIAALRIQHGFIPPDFEVYILEWPVKSSVGMIWPGLPVDQDAAHWAVGICRGINHSATNPPVLYRLELDAEFFEGGDVLDETDSDNFVVFPGLPLWQRRFGDVAWLCFAQTPLLCSSVIYSSEVPSPLEIYEETNYFGSWIEFLKQHWLKYLDEGEWPDDPKPRVWLEDKKVWDERPDYRSQRLGDISAWPIWKKGHT